MIRRGLLIVAGCSLLALGALQFVAAEQLPSDDLLEIRRSLSRIAEALEAQRSDQEIELLLRRIELEQRRLEPVERRWEAADRELRQAEDDARKLESMRAGLERTMQGKDEAGKVGHAAGGGPMVASMDSQLEAANARVTATRSRFRALEAELASGRQRIAELDKQLNARVER